MSELDKAIQESLKQTFPRQSKLRMWLRSERADMLLPLFFVVIGALILAVMELGK